MIETLLYILMTSGVLFFVVRNIMIVTGLWKDPILRAFEKYGDEESFFHPLPHLLGGLGALAWVANYWLGYFNASMVALFVIAGLLLASGFVMGHYPHLLGARPELVLNHPGWLADLLERTSRLERRRIAYMWLHLPWRLRLMYNSNDRAFREWADMVILSTLR